MMEIHIDMQFVSWYSGDIPFHGLRILLILEYMNGWQKKMERHIRRKPHLDCWDLLQSCERMEKTGLAAM